MTKEQYKARRDELMSVANKAIDDGDLEQAKEVRGQIETLDASFEEEVRVRADMNALRDKAVINIEDKSVPANNGIKKTVPGMSAPADEEKLYRSAFARAMMGQSLEAEEQRVFDLINPGINNAAQTSSDHQVMIPTSLVEEIWKEAAKIHPVLSLVNMTNVKGKIEYPKENGTGSDAAWYDEDTPVTDGNVATVSIELDGWELAKCVPVSWKLKKMSIDAFLVYLRDNLSLKMGDALATAIFSGKGKAGEDDEWKSEPLGIVTALEAESLTPQIITWTPTSDPINYAKLTSVMSKMKSGYASGAVIFAKNDFIWNHLANVLDESKRPYFIANPINGGVGMMFGKVVYEEDAAPADGMVLANVARGYKINAQENVTMYTEDHIKSRITDYMAYAIIDGKPISTAPFVYLKKSA